LPPPQTPSVFDSDFIFSKCPFSCHRILQVGQWGEFNPFDRTAAGAPVANKKLPEDVVQRIIDAYDKKVRWPPK